MALQPQVFRRIEAARERRAAAAHSAAPNGANGAAAMLLRDPEDHNLTSRLEQGVLSLRETLRPDNTAKAQDPKEEEYMQFCDALYPHDIHRYVLNSDRVYRFMFYQSFREKKRVGGRPTIETNFFDVDGYNDVMASFRAEGGNITEFPKPRQPCGACTFTAYKAVIRKIYKKQTAQRVLLDHWDRIWTEAFDELQKHVKERAPLAKKASYEEKVTGAFAPYTIVEHYDRIENALYEDGITGGTRNVGSALRNRYALLHLC